MKIKYVYIVKDPPSEEYTEIEETFTLDEVEEGLPLKIMRDETGIEFMTIKERMLA